MAKLTISTYHIKTTDGSLSAQPGDIKVQFNPTSYSLSKSVNWTPSNAYSGSGQDKGTRFDQNAPSRQPAGGNSRTFSCELFFDVTEEDSDADVRITKGDRIGTNAIYELTQIHPVSQSPPVCKLKWGKEAIGSNDYGFTGVLTNLNQNFILFAQNGNPLRAKLQVTFTEWLHPEDDKRKTDPELTTHILRQGESLSSIAGKLYQDTRQWRKIAEENDIDDPRNLKIGSNLIIPKLR